MKLQKETSGVCCECGCGADYYLDTDGGLLLCKKCALELYRLLGGQFVPRAVQNVILRSEKGAQSASFPLGGCLCEKNEMTAKSEGARLCSGEQEKTGKHPRRKDGKISGRNRKRN